MRNAFVDALQSLALEDQRILACLADNGIIVFDEYRRRCPNQFINFGIAECAAIGACAGLAKAGFRPFFYTILPFVTYRGFEFIRNDVCYQNAPVRLVGIGAGFAYSTLGPTHHGTEDIGMLRTLPNLTIFSPADPLETKKATFATSDIAGPVYIRIGKGKDAKVYSDDYDFKPGKGVVLREGSDLTLIGTGSILSACLEAADMLWKKSGIKARVVNIHTLAPVDRELIVRCANETGALMTVEEHSTRGGLGGVTAEILLPEKVKGLRFDTLGLEGFCHGYGSVEELRMSHGLDPESIAVRAKRLLDQPKKGQKALFSSAPAA